MSTPYCNLDRMCQLVAVSLLENSRDFEEEEAEGFASVETKMSPYPSRSDTAPQAIPEVQPSQRCIS